jgi:hypothetical protein
VMGIIHRAISTHIVSRAGFSNKQAKTVAVTLIQRFGSALNLNIHFHMLFLEGAINENPWNGTTFTRIKAPSHDDMVTLVHTISQRIASYLEKVGLVVRDMENSYLNLPIDAAQGRGRQDRLRGGKYRVLKKTVAPLIYDQ